MSPPLLATLLLGVPLLGALHAPRILAEEVAAVPAHPSELTFEERAVALPEAAELRHTLAGGAVAYLAEDHTLPLVDVVVGLRAGGFLDPRGKPGLAGLTGNLLRRGGTETLEPARLDERIDELGARITSHAGILYGAVGLSTPSWELETSLDLLFSILHAPRFAEDRLESARTNLLESMSRRSEDPLEVLQREWEWILVGREHFSTRPQTPGTLGAIGHDDLRSFHATYWRPENMVIAVSGDFDRRRILALLEGQLRRWPASEGRSGGISWPPEGPEHRAEPGLYHAEMPIAQAKVAFGHSIGPTIPDLEDRFALELMTEILGGGGAISLLGGRLRSAEGLVYRVSADLEVGQLWPGLLQVSFDSAPATTARALQLALEEVDRIRQVKVHPQAVEVARRTMLSRLLLSFDTAEEIAGYFVEDDLVGRPAGYWNAYRNALEELDRDDVYRVARDHLHPDRLVFVVVGPWGEVAGPAQDGLTALERVTGHAVTRLPPRDPLTLQPVEEGDGDPGAGDQSTSRKLTE